MNNSKKDLWIRHEYEKIKLSSDLFDKMDCWDNLELIKSLHYSRLDILLKMEATLHFHPATLRKLAKEATEMEYKLQEAWGFPRDSSKHYWSDSPHCNCFYKTVSDNCIIHGFVDKGYLFIDMHESV